MKDLKSKTIKGISWSGLASIVNQVVTLGVGIYLARLLEPSDFGLIAMVLVVTGFADVLKDMGFSSALIQKKEVNERQLSSVFWLNLGIGVLLTFSFIGAAPWIAKFYEKTELILMVYVMAINFTIASSIQVHVVLLNRALDFKKIAIVNTSASIFSGIVAIVLAYLGWGVWSLVCRAVLIKILACISYWSVSSWRPKFIFIWEEVSVLLSFGINLMGTSSLQYWGRKLDDVLVGKFIGDVGLGLYSRAYSFLMMPIMAIKGQVVSVAFPALSIIKEDKKRVKKIVLKVSATISLLVYALMLGLFAVADDFVLILLGEKWLDIIPTLRIFCIASLIQGINFPAIIYLSQGRADLLFRVGILVRILAVMFMVIGLNWGITGVAIGVTVGSYVNFFPALYFGGRLVNLNPFEVLRVVLPFLLMSVFMGTMVYLAGLGMALLEWPLIVSFIIRILLGALIYLALLLLFKPEPTEELLAMVNKILKRSDEK